MSDIKEAYSSGGGATGRTLGKSQSVNRLHLLLGNGPNLKQHMDPNPATPLQEESSEEILISNNVPQPPDSKLARHRSLPPG
jgi:outer membrane protein TolC